MPHKSEAFLFQQGAFLIDTYICIFKYATLSPYVAFINKQSITFLIKRISETKLFEDK